MEIWGNPEVMKYCKGAGEREKEYDSILLYIKMQQNDGFSPYAVELGTNGKFIGVCGFNPASDGTDADLIYQFNIMFWGSGYATEAARACLAYAKDTLKLNIVGATVEKGNIASKTILEKLGFLMAEQRNIGEDDEIKYVLKLGNNK